MAMRKCLAAPKLPLPPELNIFLPTLAVDLPVIGIPFCCDFTLPIPGFPIILPLGAILSALGPLADGVMALVLQVVDIINTVLDELSFSCPLD